MIESMVEFISSRGAMSGPLGTTSAFAVVLSKVSRSRRPSENGSSHLGYVAFGAARIALAFDPRLLWVGAVGFDVASRWTERCKERHECFFSSPSSFRR